MAKKFADPAAANSDVSELDGDAGGVGVPLHDFAEVTDFVKKNMATQ